MKLRGNFHCCACPQFASDGLSKLLLKWPCHFLVPESSFPTECSAGAWDVYLSTGFRDERLKQKI